MPSIVPFFVFSFLLVLCLLLLLLLPRTILTFTVHVLEYIVPILLFYKRRIALEILRQTTNVKEKYIRE